MRKILALTALAAAALAGTAIAGHKQSETVWVGGDQAGGSLGDARASGNIVEFIGCQVFGGAGGSPHAFCWARDEFDKQLTCQSSDPAVVTAATSFGPTTYVTFGPDKNGDCRFIWTLNYSFSTPAVP